MMNKSIAIASDHAGYDLKMRLIDYLTTKGYALTDYGAYSTERSDYPDFGHALASAVEAGSYRCGISLCGSGNGINMTVNKHQGVRAALCWNSEISRLARSHNDANICSLPARFVTYEEAVEIVEAFLSEPFEGGRHSVRVDKIPLQ